MKSSFLFINLNFLIKILSVYGKSKRHIIFMSTMYFIHLYLFDKEIMLRICNTQNFGFIFSDLF